MGSAHVSRLRVLYQRRNARENVCVQSSRDGQPLSSHGGPWLPFPSESSTVDVTVVTPVTLPGPYMAPEKTYVFPGAYGG
jgi:hypothetical protein